MNKVTSRRNSPERFGSLRVLRDGRVRLSASAIPELPQLDFTLVQGDTISVRWRGRVIFIMFLSQERVESTCFAHDLSPSTLREAVSILRQAKNGIERWIVPGLEYSQAALAQMSDKPRALKIIPGLLDSTRDLPVAQRWKQQRREIQREWAKWKQENPDTEVQAPAPWVLDKQGPVSTMRRRPKTKTQTGAGSKQPKPSTTGTGRPSRGR